jgi:GNAT superfamily N-acetyltransferase
VSDSSGFSCAVTGFAGMEAEVLRLRNTNRDTLETLPYLTWRYRAATDAPPPCVHWLLDPGGQRVGMAAAIFRPYWVNGERVQVAVIGDISVDAGLRGRGLGRMLLRSMTTDLDERFSEHPALVIPTESARRTLAALGWHAVGELAPLVCVLDPTRYIQRMVRSQSPAAALARVIRAAARVRVRRHIPLGGVLRLSDSIQEPLREYLRRLPAAGGVMRDLGPESLVWRYAQHPRIKFTFATFTRSGETRGFLVFEDHTLAGTCSIYDLVGETAADLRAMLALFVVRSLSTPGLVTLRVLLDGRHPARVELRRVGFIARPADAVFQVHCRDASAQRLGWRITQGDKDI